jgi:VanZ family protein
MSVPASASIARPARVQRTVSLLAFGYSVLVVYGSLVPLDPAPLPPEAAWARLSDIPFLSVGAGERADWIANILLFVPLAFLWCARAGLQPPLRRGPAVSVLAACMGFAVLLETAQLWFPPRTVSQNDILAEWIGSAIGATVWIVWGRRLIDTARDIAAGGTAGLAAALTAYGGAYVLFVLLPFDFVISATELQGKLGGAGVAPVLSPSCGGPLRCSLRLSLETASLVPLGFLVALLARQRQHRTPGVLAGAATGALIGAAIELCQIFLVSGVAQGVSVLTRAAGVALGLLLCRHWDTGRVARWIRFARPLLILAALAYAVLIAALFGRGGWQIEQAAARLQALSWLPFYYHYYTTEQGALVSLLSNAALYAPVGAGLWLWRFAASGGRRAVLPGAAAAATMAGLLAVVLEGSRLFSDSGHPDPTNIIIAAIAAPLAFRATGWVAACLLGDGLPAVRSFRR